MIIRVQSRPLFAIAYGILQNREEAEDAVQDALIKAWKSRWRVRDPEKFPAWMAAIVRYRARDVARSRRTIPLESSFDEQIDPAAGETEKWTEQAEANRQVHSALAELPELHRIALTLRYFEGMDYKSIERTLGITDGALRGILGRALQTLRKNLRPLLVAAE